MFFWTFTENVKHETHYASTTQTQLVWLWQLCTTKFSFQPSAHLLHPPVGGSCMWRVERCVSLLHMQGLCKVLLSTKGALLLVAAGGWGSSCIFTLPSLQCAERQKLQKMFFFRMSSKKMNYLFLSSNNPSFIVLTTCLWFYLEGQTNRFDPEVAAFLRGVNLS